MNWLQKISQKFMPLPATPPAEAYQPMGVGRMDNRMNQETADQLRQQYPEIEYGGAGEIGVAFRTAPGEMMKITHDWSEANAAQHVFDNPMDWVVTILEEPKMIQENPPMWSIRMEEVQPIEDGDLVVFLMDLTRMYEDDEFPDRKQAAYMVQKDFPKKMNEAMKLYDRIKYILEQNHQTFWLDDIHGGNVGWSRDGRLKVFDLGPGDFVE